MKKCILSFFLVTSVITSHAIDLNLGIQNLSEAQFKKAQELSELSKQIGEKNALIEVWSHQVSIILGADEDDKVPSISEEEFTCFVQNLESAFRQKKDLNGFLTEGFSAGTKNYRASFIKVFMVRIYFERLLVGKLIERYEKCFQEFSEIDESADCLAK